MKKLNFNLSKSHKLPLGAFAGIVAGPQPAHIYMIIQYSDDFSSWEQINGFKITTDKKWMKFEIPVMPPTVKIDFGNSKDTENVTRVGEVVLPKFKKAVHLRWDSFFPYDNSAPYLNSSQPNLINDLSSMYNTVNNIKGAINNIKGASNKFKKQPTPKDYIDVFKKLSKSQQYFKLSMEFDSSSSEDIGLTEDKYTLESFECEPENNGDYKYSISMTQYTDIGPKLLGSNDDYDASLLPTDTTFMKKINSFSDFCKNIKNWYGKLSAPLVQAFALYNGVRNFVFDGVMIAWRIKGMFGSLGNRIGTMSNMFGKSKITSKDTAYVSASLKKLSFTNASKQAADYINNNKLYRKEDTEG